MEGHSKVKIFKIIKIGISTGLSRWTKLIVYFTFGQLPKTMGLNPFSDIQSILSKHLSFLLCLSYQRSACADTLKDIGKGLLIFNEVVEALDNIQDITNPAKNTVPEGEEVKKESELETSDFLNNKDSKSHSLEVETWNIIVPNKL